MKKSTRIHLLVTFALLFGVWTCGGSGGGMASGGIGGTGIQTTSIGSVSAVGSITVNDVRFETNAAVIEDDQGNVLSESDLSEGLLVEVGGKINDDGITGAAEQVTVIAAVQGPVDQAPVANSLVVMGRPVAIDDQTVIDDTITSGGGIGSLNAGDLLEVYGFNDPNNTIRATRIEKKVTISVFKTRGFVDATPTSSTFTLNGLTINYASATQNDFGTTGPRVGDFVFVFGDLFEPGTLTLTANGVQDGQRSFGDDGNAEIDGFITVLSGSTFTLVSGAGTFQVLTDSTTEFEGGGADDLAVGLKVEVEGAFSGGALVTDSVKIEEGVRLETNVDNSTKDLVQFTIRPANMSALILKLDAQTEIDERRSGFPDGPTPLQLLNSIDGSETLRIRARVSAATVPNATELIVTELRVSDGLPDSIRLQGPLDELPAPNGDIQILGVTVTSSDAATTFFDIDDVTIISRATFLNTVTTGQLVEVEGALAVDNEMGAIQLSLED